MLTEQQNIDKNTADREHAAYLFSQAQAAQGTPSYAAALQEYQTFVEQYGRWLESLPPNTFQFNPYM